MKNLILAAFALAMMTLAPSTAQAAVNVAEKDAAGVSVADNIANSYRGHHGNRYGNGRGYGRSYGHDYRRPVYRQTYRQSYQWDRSWHNDRRYDWRGHRSRYQQYYRAAPYYAPQGYYNRSSFNIGFTIGAPFYQQNYWISNPGYYRLPNHYGDYRWVRHYNDALLIDVRTGRVVDAARDFYW